MEHEFKVIKLHDVPDVMEETAQLLNNEWPRSLEARCNVISQSSDDLPCSFVLLKVSTAGNVRTVVGFSRLSKVLQKPNSALVESVIVDKTLRGCGLGKMIMRHTEEFALKHGFEIIHLSTKNKQSFYEHLGYSLSTPVSAETKVSRFFSKSQIEKADDYAKHEKRIDSIKTASDLETEEITEPSQSGVPSSPALSIPPPLLSIPPPPPPPLSIPPPPPSIPSAPKKQISSSVSKNVERGSKGYVWMKKQLYDPERYCLKRRNLWDQETERNDKF
ncbi:N-acetyltransferase 6 [Paramuricea clavata]|uniref:N-acetyltransferase 6 n=1 Tax=Paramuricea clavata TaxID=317549 RepID=A0A7D9HCS3_PARCT|nr:N-acetyltransferase 6 [Paramuricea clavata]